jgi:hypothetical protein
MHQFGALRINPNHFIRIQHKWNEPCISLHSLITGSKNAPDERFMFSVAVLTQRQRNRTVLPGQLCGEYYDASCHSDGGSTCSQWLL